MENDICNYRLEAPHGCVAHLCALCREPIALDPGVYTAAQIDQRIAAHHAVCEKRPLEVGDLVEWRIDGWHVVGELVSHPWRPGGKAICLSSECNGMERGYVFTIAPEHEHGIRRIPRPGAGEQAPVPVFPAGTDRSQPCPTCSKSWEGHFGIACNAGDGGKCCTACGRTFSDHYAGLCRGPVPARGGQHDPVPPRCACGEDHPVDPLDVEHDGVTLRDLLVAREIADQCGHVSRFTHAQRAAVSAHWSAELRAMVAAGRAAERNRVRVDLEVEPWE